MKHNVLRAAAHNIADSLTSGVSLEFGYEYLPFWDLVGQSPQGIVEVEIISGITRTSGVPTRLADAFRRVSKNLSAFLAKHDCDLERVRRIEFKFRHIASTTSLRSEVLVIVEDVDGRSTTDRYIGSPLHRPVIVDHHGRIRTERSPIEQTRKIG